MSVILRKRKLSDGRLSLFLDIHHNGVRSKEYLQIYVNHKPKDATEKELNKTNLAIAENTRAKREISIHSEEYEVMPAFKKKARFDDYFKKFAEACKLKDDINPYYSYKLFMEFIGNKPLQFNHVTEKLAEEFKEYLLGHKRLSGGTPTIYFRAFKKAVRKAYKEKIIRDNPVSDVTVSTTSEIRKDVLTIEEIIKLNNAHCGNETIKKAFIFSCLTGLRLCDIRRLTWGQIKDTKEGLMIAMRQAKTGKDLKGNLNKDAAEIIGARGQRNDLIFKLPTGTAVRQTLAMWAKRAGINKHITYHVARHSFGTNLVYYGTDVKTASQLLGHSSLNYTSLYLHISESMKQDAVNNLPSISRR